MIWLKLPGKELDHHHLPVESKGIEVRVQRKGYFKV